MTETFVPETGSSIPVIPHIVAKEHKLYIKPIQGDEARLTDASGNDMEVVGETTFYVKFTCFSTPRRVTGLVVKNSPDRDILMDWRSLQEWGCIPKSFPYPPERTRKISSSDKTEKDVTVKEAVG